MTNDPKCPNCGEELEDSDLQESGCSVCGKGFKEMTNEPKLKPCPFCGGKPVIKEYRGFGYEIECINCQCRFDGEIMKDNDHVIVRMNKKDFVKAWNTRAGNTRPKIDVGEIANIITNYFILEKRWLKKKGRTILFGEDDSERLAKAIAKRFEGKGVKS